MRLVGDRLDICVGRMDIAGNGNFAYLDLPKVNVCQFAIA